MRVIVDTACGKVEGLERGGVLQFRGMPYGRAGRFQPAEAPLPWAGVLDATRFGPVAPQRRSPTDVLLGIDKHDTGEDCLVLNVYTPAADEARRPVMVWIHGGGFTNGSGHLPYYNGTRLALHGDVVVVTVNYRLGVFGFLHLDHLVTGGASGNGGERFAGSGNNGLRDQILALRWVRDNIAGFGGDPGRVSVFGESAGGMSVASLMATPAAQDLFHGAIAQSGAGENVLTLDEAEAITAEVLGRLDLPVDARGVERLVEAPVEAVLEAQTAVEVAELTTRPGREQRRRGQRFLKLPFEPVVDGGLLPRRPLEAIGSGSGAGIPLVVGTTVDEWNLFMLQEGGTDLPEDQLRHRAGRLVGGDPAEVDEMLDLYRTARPGATTRAVWAAIMTDHVFRMPAIRLAEAQLPHAPVSVYRFDYPSTAFGGLAGACHSVDVPFVFDMVDLPAIDMLLGGIDDGTRRLARRCARAWTTMAHTGRPTQDATDDDLDWPLYDLDRRATCILHRDPEVRSDPEGDIRGFWAR